jgi:LuxR family transcriptional regulator, maltose regulon positive regulatory protein
MNSLPSVQQAQLQDHKLTSPAYQPGKLIERTTLMQELKHLQAKRKQAILIEAPAGSGKSVFAQQYVADGDIPSGWYQIDLEDHDPVAFLHLLVLLLQKNLPGFHSGNVAKALAEGSVHYREAIHFGTLLAEEIHQSDIPAFQLVIDDLHLLEGAGDSAALLLALMRNSPDWMQWILVSRHSVKNILNVNQLHIATLIIDGDNLDFSLEETARLFQNIFEIMLPFEEVEQIQQQTEGWITGLTLWAMQSHETHRLGVKRDSSFQLSKIRHHLGEYFQEAVLATFTNNQAEKILLMALLEELPRALLERLFTSPAATSLITAMTEKNRFFRHLDGEAAIFSFHHLFRESLLPLCESRMTDHQRRDTLYQASRYHLETGDPLRALRYSIRITDFSFCESILRDFGLQLLHRNQVKTLQRILDSIPPQYINDHPWLSFYYGACKQDSEPARALSFLRNAKKLFAEIEDDIGLLVTNSQLIEYHAIIDGQFNAMQHYVEELEAVFALRRQDLPLNLQLRMSHSLALGFCFLQMNMEKVRHYDTWVLQTSEEHGLENMTAMARLIRAYRYSFVGNLEGCLEELEASLPFLANPRVAGLTKLFIYLLQVNLLEMTGDFINYREQRQELVCVGEQDALVQSVIGPLLAVLDADMALAEGDMDGVERYIEQGLQNSYAGAKPHMRSQFLYYQAMAYAVKGQRDDALAAISESLRLREQTGAASFVILAHLFAGAVYARLGLAEEALQQFSKALEISCNLDEEFNRAAIYAHRAMLQVRVHGEEQAFDDVRSCLELMRKNKYKHFFSFMPDIMRPLLQLAIRHNIETQYAALLLAETLHSTINREGRILPFLKIRLLDDWCIVSVNGALMRLHDLSRNEKILLLALVESPGNCLDRNGISERLWPEKTEKKQRSSLDVLISHLRRKLTALAEPFSSKEYLVVEQGIVKLQHFMIDAFRFLDFARVAQRHHQQGKIWQASNSFHLAFNHWGDMGCEGMRLAESSYLADKVENEYIKCTKIWAGLLRQQGKQEKALQLLDSAFRQRSHDLELARQLYNLHVESNNRIEAQKVIQRYQQACRDTGSISDVNNAAAGVFWQ